MRSIQVRFSYRWYIIKHWKMVRDFTMQYYWGCIWIIVVFISNIKVINTSFTVIRNTSWFENFWLEIKLYLLVIKESLKMSKLMSPVNISIVSCIVHFSEKNVIRAVRKYMLSFHRDCILRLEHIFLDYLDICTMRGKITQTIFFI